MTRGLHENEDPQVPGNQVRVECKAAIALPSSCRGQGYSSIGQLNPSKATLRANVDSQAVSHHCTELRMQY